MTVIHSHIDKCTNRVGFQLSVKHFALAYSKANKIPCHTYFRQSYGQHSLFDKRPFDHQYILLIHTPKLLKTPDTKLWTELAF